MPATISHSRRANSLFRPTLSSSLSIVDSGMQYRCKRQICLAALCSLLAGCAQTNYSAGNLPAKFGARRVRDYSSVDLTSYANRIPDTDKILPGDRLEVNLDAGTSAEDAEHVWKVSVNATGEAALPHIGPVKLAGLTNSEAEKAIVQTSLSRDVFLTPAVSVGLEKRRERKILVTGAVATPGVITITEDHITLADAIVRAGGMTASANGEISVSAASSGTPSVVDNGGDNAIRQISQSNFQAMTISLETASPFETGQTMVPEGAVVHVEEQPIRPIQVSGVIRNQVVEIPAGQNYRLLDAITLASGQTYSNWISDRITITREVPGSGETVRIKASIRKARADARENILLAPNDIVNVEENALTFTLSTLSGFIGAGANAARVGI